MLILNNCPVAPAGVEAIAKLTPTPEIALPPPSVTMTTSGLDREVLIIPDCPFPDVNKIAVAEPGVAVAVNVTGLPLKLPDVAVTVYVPALFPNVNTVET